MNRKGAFLLLGGLLVGLLLGLVIFMSGTTQPGKSQRRLPPVVGSPVQDFELPVLNGGTRRLSKLQGKPVVINFWATWCGPCKEEMPLLGHYAAAYTDDLVFLGVNYAEKQDVVQAFITKTGIMFPILLDETGQVSDQYFVRNFPTTFFIDADGVLRAQHTGLLSEELLKQNLALIGIE